MRFIETSIFTEDVSNELWSDGYRQMQVALMLRPEQGAVIRGSAGLRKIRWRRAGMGERGGTPSDRTKLGKSQAEFALMIGVSVGTLQSWEQGRRQPEGPARALLRVAARRPKAVVEALAS